MKTKKKPILKCGSVAGNRRLGTSAAWVPLFGRCNSPATTFRPQQSAICHRKIVFLCLLADTSTFPEWESPFLQTVVAGNSRGWLMMFGCGAPNAHVTICLSGLKPLWEIEAVRSTHELIIARSENVSAFTDDVGRKLCDNFFSRSSTVVLRRWQYWADGNS